MPRYLDVMTRALSIGVFAVLTTACSNAPVTGDDEVVSSADALVGRWRALDASETRVFLGDGSTWVEGDDFSSRERGRYRLLSPGQLEMQIDGASAEMWTATFGHVGATVLRLRDAGGQTHGYVDASTRPGYAPTTTSGEEP